MDTDVDTIRVALANLTNSGFRALIWAANNSPQATPGLLAWLEEASNWELHRRVGVDHELQPLECFIRPSDAAASINAINAIKSIFGKSSGAVPALLGALLDELGFIERSQSRCEISVPPHPSRRVCPASRSR